MEKTTYICDVCGRTKQETNHWFQFATGLQHDHTGSVIARPFLLVRWEDSLPELFPPMMPVQHICGAECIMKKLSEYLGIQHQ